MNLKRKIKIRKRRERSRFQYSNINWELAGKIFKPEKERVFDQLKEEIERYPYLKETLAILAAGALVSASLIIPGLPRVLKPFLWQGRGYKRKRLTQALKRLYKQKLVEVVEVEGVPVVRITQNGMVKALNFRLDKMEIKKPRVWDRKWRIVIFDIAERQKSFREIFRESLKNLGFYRLQDSVFVHPYPCFDEIEFLRQIYRIEIGVTYILAEKIEGEGRLKDFFNLE